MILSNKKKENFRKKRARLSNAVHVRITRLRVADDTLKSSNDISVCFRVFSEHARKARLSEQPRVREPPNSWPRIPL